MGHYSLAGETRYQSPDDSGYECMAWHLGMITEPAVVDPVMAVPDPLHLIGVAEIVVADICSARVDAVVHCSTVGSAVQWRVG